LSVLVPDRDHLVRRELDLQAAGQEPLDARVAERCGRLISEKVA